jgi:tetratricopeptide (TPR) repeat protein
MSDDLLTKAQQHLDWADNYFDEGDFEHALDESDRGIDLAEQAVEAGQGARDALETLADAYNLRGAVLEELSRLPEAADMYREALRVDPGLHEARDNLRDVLGRLDRPEERLVTVATFSAAPPAHIVRGRLEAEGLYAVVADENTVNANWFYSNFVGGVKVQVPESQVEAARRILHTRPGPLPPEAYEDGEVS